MSTITILLLFFLVSYVLFRYFKSEPYKWGKEVSSTDAATLFITFLIGKLINILNDIRERKNKNDRRGFLMYFRRLALAFTLAVIAVCFRCPAETSAIKIVSIYNSIHTFVYCSVIVISVLLFIAAVVFNTLDICRAEEEYKKKKKINIVYLTFHSVAMYLFCFYIWHITTVAVSCNSNGHEFFDLVKSVIDSIIRLFD